MAVPAKVQERMCAGLARMKPVLLQQRQRDVSEADTVTLVKDTLECVFGYDKYAELTGELAIRGTYCDLAVKLNDKVQALIEVKAVGISLDDRHLKQAVDYAANHGCEWVVLTNAIVWRLYCVVFAKPIDKQLVLDFDLSQLDPKREEVAEALYPITREGVLKGAHAALRDRQVATSRYMLAALVVENENVLTTIRRELRRVVDIGVEEDELSRILADQVVKRDCFEGVLAEQARELIQSRVGRAMRKPKRKREESSGDDQSPPADVVELRPSEEGAA
ncbi:MAG: hypothetical protein GHCLOJNM_01553 [bacterium]|nr:hypothetical protein [bacterium]